MNRIVIVGNGFDLAHGLKTSYQNFIDWYWKQKLDDLYNENISTDNDPLLSLPTLKSFFKNKKYSISTGEHLIATIQQLKERISELTEGNQRRVLKSAFFKRIVSSLRYKGWVDIENEYYDFLSRFQPIYENYPHPDPLNKELDFIKMRLIDYLNGIQENQINEGIIHPDIKQKILEPIQEINIAIKNRKEWNDFKTKRGLSTKEEWRILCHQYNLDVSSYIPPKNENAFDLQFMDIGEVPQKAYLPDHIKILNFNYTKTADLYLPKEYIFTVNHIHGELDNPQSVIFGYGDELDEHYKELVNKNENAYLSNIKSIKYLESDRYRKLLSFMESDSYQIYIMGHSCGNSDRTLLNKLFEHPNCVSIKPFYFQKLDGTDNYTEIIQNISRNFTDMNLMRDRVVNKTYCEPFSFEKEHK